MQKMGKMIQCYMKDLEKELNVELMNKSYDRPLEEYLMDCWKSLEVVKNIKIIRYEYDESANQDINDYVKIRSKSKAAKKNKSKRIKNVKDSIYGSLTVWIEVTVSTAPSKGGVIKQEKCVIKKKITVPLVDEDGYLYIKGKRYFLIYQLLEKSTYITAQCVTLKSLMPITVKRNIVEKEDIDGNIFKLPTYNIFVFRNELNIMLFYATRGLDNALVFLGLNNAIRFIDDIENRSDEFLYFQLSTKAYLEVNKELFLKYQYIQAISGMIMDITSNRFTLELVNDKEHWIKKLGTNNSYDKGLNILIFFNRLLDETAKKTLKIDQTHTKDIYTLLRWAMQNFNELRLKDNLSLENKRLRCNEYIAALLTQEFSKKLNRVISLGARASMDDFKDCFKMPGDIIIQKMHSSGVLRMDETVNDLDFFAKFKYTKKGPHSLGAKNARNISVKQKGLDPSFLGYIDVTVCSNSDPGTSGVLSPFCKMDGMYFNNADEPDVFTFNFLNDMHRIMAEKDVDYIEMEFETPSDYYKMLNKMVDFNKDNIKIMGVSKNKPVIEITKYDMADLDSEDRESNKDILPDIPDGIVEEEFDV